MSHPAKYPPRRVIVLGALSAIAEATCRLLAEEGASLALLGRDAPRLESVAADLRVRGAKLVVTCAQDLTAVDDAAGVLKRQSDAIGGADAVLIFYGLLGDQAQAETDWSHAKALIDVNFTSAAAWALAGASLVEAAPDCRGVLLAVSSVAGDRGRRSIYVYGAAKGALSILVQGIAHRFGTDHRARAVVVKLGFVDTPMTDGVPKSGPLWAKPQAAAAVIRRAMEKGGPIVYGPWFWRWILLAIRVTPQFVFDKVNL
jgi:NAD(P)-dependent dehydrogenase (short-subunit alcohol dehydrogenase family)